MKLTIPLSEISETGTEKTYTDQSIWLDPIKEFSVPCTIVKPMQAEVFLLKQEEGCLIRGELSGSASLSCDRCGEHTEYPIFSKFEDFEETPQIFEEHLRHADKNKKKDSGDFDLGFNEESALIFYDTHNILRLDLGSLLWEEFSLALPVKPLCSESCKGICPSCGTNKNKTDCDCDTVAPDPRFAKLKNFKVSEKKQ